MIYFIFAFVISEKNVKIILLSIYTYNLEGSLWTFEIFEL